MKFRSPTEKPIRVALLTGHVAIVGREWRELDPIYQREALALGAQADATTIENPDVVPEAGEEATRRETDGDDAIRKAIIKMLGREEDGDFVASTGLPNVKTVEKLVGFRVTKEQVHGIFREMKNEAEQTAEGEAEPS